MRNIFDIIRHRVGRIERDLLARSASRKGFCTEPRFNVRVAVDPEIVSPSIAGMISTGFYENVEASLLCRLVQNDDSILELGAGLGFIAALLMRECKPRTYCAVEADERLLPLIRRTAVLNGVIDRLEVRNAILTEDDQKLHNGSTPFHQDPEFWFSRECITGSISVPTLSFNSLLKGRSILIVDIEGGEEALFDGADLSSLRAVSIELHPRVIGADGVRKVFRRMHDAGLGYDSRFSSFQVVTFTAAAST